MTCPECKGRGTISFGQGGFAVNRPCPVCLGRGQVPTERCPTCAGAGEVRTRRKVSITVPSGVDTGTKIRLKGQGGSGTKNGPPGDLLITFHVKPDRFYKREGLDLIAPVPINIAQATLGSKSQREDARREEGGDQDPAGHARRGSASACAVRGSRRTARRGDLIVEVEVAVPEKLTPEQEEAMKAVRRGGWVEVLERLRAPGFGLVAREGMAAVPGDSRQYAVPGTRYRVPGTPSRSDLSMAVVHQRAQHSPSARHRRAMSACAVFRGAEFRHRARLRDDAPSPRLILTAISRYRIVSAREFFPHPSAMFVAIESAERRSCVVIS